MTTTNTTRSLATDSAPPSPARSPTDSTAHSAPPSTAHITAHAVRDTARLPAWLIAAAGLGLAWNLFGAVQFAGAVTATPDSLVASGLTAEQAAVMTGYPGWMTAAFAIGVFGGVAGSALLMMQHRAALPVLALSLVAYLVLYVGDITEGVFTAMGAPQVIVLTLVVAIAAGLVWLARQAGRIGRTG